MTLWPKNTSFHDAHEFLPGNSCLLLTLESGEPAAGHGDERLGEELEDDWDHAEAEQPTPELPWEVWDPLDDEPEEPDPRDYWPDLPDEDD